ncbi:MAG: HAMP domain-containing protein [Treponema sp.]|nr:HAMP domain-containing protein [Treponema sp.]
MKNTIWSKIFLFAVIPFLIIYTILAAIILRSIFNDKISQVELDVRNLARFNEVRFQGYIENTRLSVMIAAAELELIDPALPDARSRGEKVIIASFSNETVYNSWLIFEPNAFDGRDENHRGEYPGETSGRYMRSYIREGSGFVETGDMDETLLEDMAESYWYLVPKLTKEPFIDISTDYETTWDYGTGEGPVFSISLAAPIMRDGQFIGCVGQDILLTDLMLGPELIPGAVSALFTPNGILRYFRDTDMMEKTLEELGFPNPEKIREAFAANQELYLSGQYSPLLQAPALTWFVPVRLAGFDETLYVYAAMPESDARKALDPLLGPIVVSLVLVLLIFGASLLYLAQSISKPIHDLILACEAISQGNFDVVIPQSRSRGEVGIMIRFLHRMVEQFKLYIAMQNRSQELLDIYTRLYKALYQHDRVEDVFDEVIPLISDYFKVHKASLVFVSGENARLLASYERGSGLKKEGAEIFSFHRQALALLADRKYISMNLNVMRQLKVSFAEEKTQSLCILPFLAADKLRAYVIMEGDSETGPLIHGDAVLLFISQTVSYVLTQREAAGKPYYDGEPAAPLPEEEVPPAAEIRETPLEAARAIEGLDVDKGLFHSGGNAEQYGDLLRISARSFAGKLEKMRSLYREDLPAFAIEIHGIKGALYAIGAVGLGDEAKALEFAAKAGEAAQCAQGYPVFEEKFALFIGRLAAIPRQREIPSRGPGNIPELIASLKDALEASRLFNSDRAGRIINSLLEYFWEESPQRITESLEKIADALECMDYDEAEQEMSLLLEALA